MEAICVKLDTRILKNIDEKIKKFNYSTRTDFIREAIRSKISELEKDQALKKIAEFRGKFKGSSKLSDEEARLVASQELAKKFGMKLN